MTGATPFQEFSFEAGRHDGGIRHQGQRQHIDADRAGALQGASAGLGGRARGDDVIDKDDLGAGDHRFARGRDGKGAGNVLAALLPAQAHLRLGSTHPKQRERLHRDVGYAGDLMRQDR